MMVRVLLVEPYDFHKGEYSFPAPSLGVWRICGYLRKNGIDCSVFTPNIHEDVYGAFEDTINSYLPTVIGFSITSMTLTYDVSLIYRAREKCAGAILIGGGIGGTFEYETLLEISPLDYCIVGEGELPMLEICSRLKGRKYLDTSTKGLVYRRAGCIIKNPNPPLDYTTFREATFSIPYDEMPIGSYWAKMAKVENLRDIPDEEKGRYLQEIKSVRIMTMNHCPMKCAFCSYTNFLDFANNKSRTDVIRLSSDDIIEMVVKVAGIYPDVKTIIFQDDLFIFRKDNRIFTICETILKLKSEGKLPADLSFMASCRIDLMDKIYLDVMRKSGFRLIGYGAESFSRNILREYGKEAIYEKIEDTLNQTLDSGIKPFLDILLVSPDSNLEDIIFTLNKCVEYILKGCEVSIYPLVIPFAGSRMSYDPRLRQLIRYEYMNIPGTEKWIWRGHSIRPRDEVLRGFLDTIENAAKKYFEDFRHYYGVRHFPSRLRSLMFIMAAIESYPDLFKYSKDDMMDKILYMIDQNAEKKVL